MMELILTVPLFPLGNATIKKVRHVEFLNDTSVQTV